MIQKIFTQQDQELFAKLSGDYNPMHLDALYARRLMFGRQVVHGIHLLLWAFDVWLQGKAETVELCDLKADFTATVAVSETVECYVLSDCCDEGVKIRLTVGGLRVAVIHATYVSGAAAVNPAKANLLFSTPQREECERVPVNALGDLSGRVALHLDGEAVDRLFSFIPLYLSPVQFAVLLATTRIVGMKCPGMNSVFSGLLMKFSFNHFTLPELLFRVSDFDDRFSRMIVEVSGSGVVGKLSVFYRPAQKIQSSYVELSERVVCPDLSGQRALVIGGSRGLGEVTAKLLALGGADVRITYHRGAEDANRVVDEIKSGGGTAEAVALDIVAPKEDIASRIGDHWNPTHLYYFATPFIFDGSRGKFSAALFDTFCHYYVTGFLATFQALKARGVAPRKVFYPSSVAVTEIPLDMGEYAAAKAAGESVCQFLDKTEKETDVLFVRLPRLDTDQTASIVRVDNMDPVPVMLDIIRQLK